MLTRAMAVEWARRNLQIDRDRPATSPALTRCPRRRPSWTAWISAPADDAGQPEVARAAVSSRLHPPDSLNSQMLVDGGLLAAV